MPDWGEIQSQCATLISPSSGYARLVRDIVSVCHLNILITNLYQTGERFSLSVPPQYPFHQLISEYFFFQFATHNFEFQYPWSLLLGWLMHLYLPQLDQPTFTNVDLISYSIGIFRKQIKTLLYLTLLNVSKLNPKLFVFTFLPYICVIFLFYFFSNQAIPRHSLLCLLLTNTGWDRHIPVSLQIFHTKCVYPNPSVILGFPTVTLFISHHLLS